MAVRFGKLYGNGSQFWFNLQRNYDLARAERSVDFSRIPTLETMHSWTTALRNCTSLRMPKLQCVTMHQMSFVYSAFAEIGQPQGVTPTMMAGRGE